MQVRSTPYAYNVVPSRFALQEVTTVERFRCCTTDAVVVS